MARKKDGRTYITLHDGMPDHPKVDGLSDAAFRLLIDTWCWCSRHLTDGQVPATTWDKRGTAKARRELLAAGLAVQVDGGVAMHDYLEHQRSADEVRELSVKRSEAGRRGGRSRANGQASAKQDGKQVLDELSSKTQAESVTVTEGASHEAPTAGADKPRPSRRHRVTDDFEITPGMRAWAAENTPGIDVDSETAQFLDHHQAKGSVMADWTRAWHTWMRNARRFNSHRAPGANSVRLDPSKQDYTQARI